ncbi:MAG: class I SAM-dependent methyltransferase [Acidobacteriota bacterium]
MRRWRRAYYDIFAPFYDGFIALHSGDKSDAARRFLAALVPVGRGGAVLDLCTGTGTLLSYLQEKVGEPGRVVGVDFSSGMLQKAREKTSARRNISVVEADVTQLPFDADSFDAVTCSHAFYELKGEIREKALGEIVRVLRPGGAFLMMEHETPVRLIPKLLFFVRLWLAGSGHAIAFLRLEEAQLAKFFVSVKRMSAPGGRSKVLVCRKKERDS